MGRGVCWFRSDRAFALLARKFAGVKTPEPRGMLARLKSCPVTKHD
jgi:hypothetical protein